MLKEVEGFKEIYIRKNYNEEEWKKLKEQREEAKLKNDERSEEEKNTFFWRVKSDRIVKWYIKERK